MVYDKSAVVSSEHTIAIAQQKGILEKEFRLADVAILTFSGAVLERLTTLCDLEEITWLPTEIHPYATPEIVKSGTHKDTKIVALVPPMGASPFSCIVEDLVTCGVRAIFLVCPAWSLGEPVEFGDLIIPKYSVGIDGTSIHYGNSKGYIDGNEEVTNALSAACEKRNVRFHVGGNATCEAMYRISHKMIEECKEKGCLSMENGEANTLFAMSRELGFLTGIVFQPFVDLTQGWNPDKMDKNSYLNACNLQVEIVLDVVDELKRKRNL